MIILLFLMFDGGQRLRIKIWSVDLKYKLRLIKRIIDDDERRISFYLKNLGFDSPSILINRVANYFVIEPVSVEPTDIIKRLDHLIRVSDEALRRIIDEYVKGITPYTRSLLESSLAIYGSLNQVYRVLRHYIILGEKQKNWILLMQLELVMPQIIKIIEAYHKALDSFLTGKPIGDGVGPCVVHRLAETGKVVSRRVVEETSVIELSLNDRRIFVIKAEGPGSNVGKPGFVLNSLVNELSGNVDLIVTIDAALKLEGERTGEIAEGVGAAIGDPGPEKIAIERAASKYNIPLKAIVVKMSLEDAIMAMKKEIYEASERALEHLIRVIKESTKPNSTIIVAGIGNTMGIP